MSKTIDLNQELPFLDVVPDSALKVVLKSVGTTALGKFIGHARSFCEGQDDPEKAARASEGMDTHAAIYYAVVDRLNGMEGINPRYDLPSSLSGMLDFMCGGKKADVNEEAAIQALVKKGFGELEARQLLSRAAESAQNNPLEAVRDDIEALWQATESDSGEVEGVSLTVAYSYAVKASKAVQRERGRLATLIVQGRMYSDRYLKPMDAARDALIAWDDEMRQGEVGEWLAEQYGRGYPADTVSDMFNAD